MAKFLVDSATTVPQDVSHELEKRSRTSGGRAPRGWETHSWEVFPTRFLTQSTSLPEAVTGDRTPVELEAVTGHRT